MMSIANLRTYSLYKLTSKSYTLLSSTSHGPT